MENLHNLLLTRHSIRRYKDEPVDSADVRTIIEAGLLAPSSKSGRPWQFVIVEDKEMLARMAECKQFGTKPISTAAFAVVVAVDSTKSDVYVEDATCAALLMHLQAADLGLGSCWIQVRNRFAADGEDSETVIRELLGIPDDISVECIVTFGHIDETRRPVDPDKLLWEKVHIGKW